MVKVGDKVRAHKSRYSFITNGRDYIVKSIAGPGFFIQDDDGDATYFTLDEGFIVVENSEELAALRAWKEQAIARFPALEQPETDDEAADRFARALEDEGPGEGVHDVLLAAFAWARENNR